MPTDAHGTRDTQPDAINSNTNDASDSKQEDR